MIKLLLAILLVIGFIFVLIYHVKTRKKQNTEPETENKNPKQTESKPYLFERRKFGDNLNIHNPVIQPNPIFYGKTNRNKKTNYIHLSKRTRKKHRKSC